MFIEQRESRFYIGISLHAVTISFFFSFFFTYIDKSRESHVSILAYPCAPWHLLKEIAVNISFWHGIYGPIARWDLCYDCCECNWCKGHRNDTAADATLGPNTRATLVGVTCNLLPVGPWHHRLDLVYIKETIYKDQYEGDWYSQAWPV